MNCVLLGSIHSQHAFQLFVIGAHVRAILYIVDLLTTSYYTNVVLDTAAVA
jgi:hypothetical protein